MKRLFRVLATLVVALTTLPLFAQQNPPSPIEQFAQGVWTEFLNALPALISVVGGVFVFGWLLTMIMRRVKQASR